MSLAEDPSPDHYADDFVAGGLRDSSFTSVFTHALQGRPCTVVGVGDPGGEGDVSTRLPVGDWVRDADAADLTLLSHCEGPTLDIGCGPGRLAAALAERGRVVLGIDVVHEAVGQTRDRGVAALRRDVFQRLPGEGRWSTALLADGNVGIGGDPVALLRRTRELIDPRGRIVVEVAEPGCATQTLWAVLECAGARSRPFRWAVVGADAVHDVAEQAGLGVRAVHEFGGRWCAVLGDWA
ncbi:MAG: class I SAM-dependent methyltransferase [Nocardioides sp.]|nr:class I SAM-dependent methyltransferase [Nocardioides sp.]